ncbi:hypothetical protein M9H77_05083 [Catharanthus roseus]|uniref:Uncharacterized protein n=1 Tax=Catharanthus roseus TaxID=4058 RepID=A0ACC0CFZ9_CATRO|nr:hypothetical protein M9H77_05083 [Catharanthus roseus]
MDICLLQKSYKVAGIQVRSVPWWWVVWQKPSNINTYVLNCDGSLKKKIYGSSGYIIRSSEGVPLFAGAIQCPIEGLSVYFHEAKAILYGIIEVVRSFHFIEHLEIRSDSKGVINVLNQKEYGDFPETFGEEEMKVINQINSLAKSKLKSYRFVWVEREANMAADFLAGEVNKKGPQCHSKCLRYKGVNEFPNRLKSICIDDSNGIGRKRVAKTPNVLYR